MANLTNLTNRFSYNIYKDKDYKTHFFIYIERDRLFLSNSVSQDYNFYNNQQDIVV